MTATILDWQHMTGGAIDALDRDHTVILVTSSPLEVHGPHLPTVTDICESEGLMTRVAEILVDRHPELTFVRLPPLYVASDVLPHVGSLSFRPSTIRRVFTDLGRTLCAQGFRDVWVSGFHGGPRHFTPIEEAAEVVNHRHGGRMVSVFSLLMDVLTQGRTDLSEVLGQVAGIQPADLHGDAHGGCVETSLMLHLLGEHVDPCWHEVGPSTVARWLQQRGEPPLAFDDPPRFRQLLRNFKEKLRYYDVHTWSGDPSLSSPELGARFLESLATHAADALEPVWLGERAATDCHAPTWKARWLFTTEWISHLFERSLGYRSRVW